MLEVDVVGAGGALPAAAVRRLCVLAAASVGVRHGHLAVEFVDARRIAALNAEHRGRQVPTDVLSFPIDGAEPLAGVESAGCGVVPAGDSGDAATSARTVSPRELGDLLICPEHTVDLREAVVHGVLHLVGLDHETDDGEMLELQRRVLAQAAA
jgi:probable rRNA maturation factor